MAERTWAGTREGLQKSIAEMEAWLVENPSNPSDDQTLPEGGQLITERELARRHMANVVENLRKELSTFA